MANLVLGGVVNAGRSIPFIILMVAIIPLTRTADGYLHWYNRSHCAIDRGSDPFVARIAEGALNEVPSGLVEAAQSMGASPLQIVTRVLLPEARPGLINA